MEAAAEVGKKNGQTKGKHTTKPAVDKPAKEAKPAKVTGWSIARTMLASGKDGDAIKKAVATHVLKTMDAKEALEFAAKRLAVRALFRAKRAAVKAAKKGGAKNGSK